jgi:protein gp37
MVKSKMFDCITETWNPLCGECLYKCTYCWARKLIKRYNMKKYTGEPRLKLKELSRKFKPDSMVFVQDMSDLFALNVKVRDIQEIFNIIRCNPETTFLLLTKNPIAYTKFNIPSNCICGATVESITYYHSVSLAPMQPYRLIAMKKLDFPRKMISIEPIMDFPFNLFLEALKDINPEFIYIGKDNYHNKLVEPSDEKIECLVDELKKFTEVRQK